MSTRFNTNINTRIHTSATRIVLLLSMAVLAACASKVRLDDLPAVVDRPNSGGIYSGLDSTTRSGADSSSVNATTGVSGTAASSNQITTIQAGGTGNTTGSNNAADAAGLLAKRSVYFDYDSYEVRDEFKTVLQAHAKNLSTKRTVKIALEGHTDERGGAEYNLALGQKRANAVLQTLQTLGVPATQMEAVSFGKEKPKAQGTSEAGFAENRRVDIRY